MVNRKKVKKATKKTSKKRVASSKVKKSSGRSKKLRVVSRRASGRKFKSVISNFIVFLILFVASYLLYNVSSAGVVADLLFVLAVIFAFVCVALIIVLLILSFLRLAKR